MTANVAEWWTLVTVMSKWDTAVRFHKHMSHIEAARRRGITILIESINKTAITKDRVSMCVSALGIKWSA